MANMDNFARALAGFGAGVQGQGPQFLAGLREQEKESALKQLGQDLASGAITQDQYIKSLAAQDPDAYSKIALAQYTNKAPAALQINAEIEKSLKSGDMERANRLAWLARSGAYGIDTFGTPQGMPQAPTQPPMQQPTPAQPTQDAPQQPSALQNFGTPQNMTPVPNSIAQQMAANAGLKKGAETQAQKDIELNMNPQIAFQTAIEEARAGLSAEQQSEYANNAKVSPIIADLYALNEKSPDMPYAGSTQWVRRLYPGTSEAETAIDLMQQARTDLAAPLAKQLGVNPTDKDFQASLDRIFDIDASKEGRAAQIKALANRIENRQKQISGEGTLSSPKKDDAGNSDVRTKLKDAGFSGEQINEYIKAKGL